MRARLFTILIILSFSVSLFGQEEQWESQFKVTGYVATEYEYFKDIKYFPKDYAFSLSEGGLLVNYQPLKNLTIKTVFVYRPGFKFDNMLNEANVEYKLNNYLNVKVGRFLTPLSPMNTYYYAPVNNSATLPIMISHHEFFPLNMDAVSLNGKFGESFKLQYNVFGGGFRNTLWLRTGSMGLFGYEDTQLIKTPATVDIPDVNADLSVGGGAHFGITYLDNFEFGFGLFTSEDPFFDPISQMSLKVKKFSYGFNLKAKVSTLQLLAEGWHSDVKIFEATEIYEGGFAELSNTFNKITPYARYEYHYAPAMMGAPSIMFNRYTAGINYKPIFETTMKLEYVRYEHEVTDLNGIVATLIFSF